MMRLQSPGIVLVLVATFATNACKTSDGEEDTSTADATDVRETLTDTAGEEEVDGDRDSAAGDGPRDSSADAADTGAPELVWLRHDDGESAGVLDDEQTPANYYEYARFRLDAPGRIHRLRAQLDIPVGTEVTAHIWEDYGGNGATFDDGEHLGGRGPLATATRRVGPEDGDSWVDFTFEEPVTVDPGRLIFAGIVVDGDDAARLHYDGGQPNFEQFFPRSNVWRTTEPRSRGGGLPIQPAPGDFMVRLEVEHLRDPEAQPSFEARPVDAIGLGTIRRIAVADVDDDGDLDVMLNGPRLYLNDGDGEFTEVTDAWLPEEVDSNGGLFADYDNDGDPDYFATGEEDHLLDHRGDRFVDVTDESGIDDTQPTDCEGESGEAPAPTEGTAWFDYDNDGWLDLYQANYHYKCGDASATDAGDRLWRNEKDGTFTRADLPVGTDDSNAPPQAGRGAAPADADGDGFVDLLVTNYRLDRNFFLKNRNGTLLGWGTDTGLAGTPTETGDTTYRGHSIGAAWGDVDRDGYLDVFVANLAHPRYLDFSQRSALYINDLPDRPFLQFTDEIDRAGFRYQETASNPNLWDYDNDGDLDLFYTCVYDNRRSMMYRNDGHPDWREVSFETGITVEDGWGSAVADLDGDGDLDLLAADTVFFNKNPENHNAVFVRAVGTGAGQTNRSGFGARVTAEIEDALLLREQYGGHGTTVQDSPWMHVGLAEAESAELTVDFPSSGASVEVSEASAGERIVVHEDGTVKRE